MSEEIAISVEKVSKAYRIWESPSARLISPLQGGLAGLCPKQSSLGKWLSSRSTNSYRDFYALRDVSFSLKKGKSVGIIGRNGSGKSTLLQLIAGTLQPTAGSVRVNGRIAALLELGSGFNPEFTGRENVYLNGAVLGLTKQEVAAKFDEISAFADIGNFIDQPAKTYSSGMLIRLAFAVAVSVEPEVLIVDEALSVGDVFFQQKCFKRVHEMIAKGVSLLFVSHDTSAVQNLCDRVVLLVGGTQVFEGAPEEAVSRYYAHSAPSTILKSTLGTNVESPEKTTLEQILASGNMRAEAKSEHGTGDLTVHRVGIFNSLGQPVRHITTGGKLRIIVELCARMDIVDPNTGIHLHDRMNNLVFAAGTRQLRTQFIDFAAGEKRLVEFSIDMTVQPGLYTFSVGCGQASDDPNAGYIQHRLEGLGPITVIPAEEGTWPFYGIAKLPMAIVIHG